MESRTAKLRGTIQDLESFSHSLVHDLRAPLRAMHAFATLLETDSESRLTTDAAEFLHRIRIAAGRMDQLITDSLNYSKILKAELRLQPVNLGKLLHGLLETYPNLQTPGVKISLEVDDVLVQGNEAALTQVFSNLLGNAVKFVAPGVSPDVRVWAERPPAANDDSVLIWVQDNGIGIPRHAHDKIFGMFQRLHRADEYPGTGIGLAIVRKSLERIGGQVCFDSEPGKGSRFCVLLRRAKPTEVRANHPAQAA